ncbi:MAG: F0F1 ATP synthase subunit epsilon [Gammaproteobacteria bacterium]|jgi:F-type H+-transporting ATPase subunit epsilon|nr:F0F1 ATP synthase subunit epsilon [Gammaproteobacteria bacterium]MBT4194953.1 F0F1 ATP synthase subunit epsilon [Gammaproteobacteria bacterium]MBT4451660.1 F0F1 ATP synthase subunit epsilon [Gammaproteobacteria bacterium]MBT6552661.1 F0F1 ATP synthase subunit epsilon [Gammaproteobacteria bacterium]MBT7045661.1 F0F1 ATP synthase subunit epsilon [Gammaproteobacteria bacterium]
MSMTIHVDIVSAEEQIFSGLAEMVYAPAIMGEVGIAPRHTPLISPLKPGEVRLDLGDGKEEFFFISGGVLEVQPHVVTILSDTAIRAHDLDEAAAIEAKKRAEEALSDQKSDIDVAKARAEIASAAAQIAAIQKLKINR